MSALAFAYSVTPGPVSPTGPSGGGYMGQGSWFANGQYYGAGVHYGIGTVAGAIRAAARGAIRFAGIAGVIYQGIGVAGWIVNELGEITKDDAEQRPLNHAAYPWCLSGNNFQGGGGGLYCADTPQELCSYFMGRTATNGAIVIGCRVHSSNPNMWLLELNNGGEISFVEYATAGNPNVVNANARGQGTPVTDSELFNAFKNDQEAMRGILNDSNGQGRRFPEFVAAENALRDALAQRDGAPVGTTGQGSNNPDTPEEPQGPAPAPQKVEMPVFCTWAKVVCDFIVWVKTDEQVPDVPMPEDTTPIEMQEWNSGLASNGGCPAPIAINVWNSPLEFSYKPACDFADFMRLIVLAIAAIVSGFIIAGLRQTNA